MMTIDMENQFRKLKDIAMNKVDKFSFSDSEYHGPVGPTSIITFGFDTFRINALVLAEDVPTFYSPIKEIGQNLYEAIIVHLHSNFEFTYYDPDEKKLGQLNVLIGNPDYSYDGTVEEAKKYFEKMNWSFDVLYSEKYTP